VYKHYVVHPDTVTAAHMAACAAGKQGKFLELYKTFWKEGFAKYAETRDPSVMGREALDKMAASIGLDPTKFAGDIESDECSNRLKADMAELSKFGVTGTPSFFINGRFTMFAGPGPFKKMIDEELARVEKSGVPAGEYYEKKVLGEGLDKFRSKADAKGG
jgi:protein-disulfide isomerase